MVPSLNERPRRPPTFSSRSNSTHLRLGADAQAGIGDSMTTQAKTATRTLFDSGAEIASEPEVSDDTPLATTAQAGKAMVEQWIEHGPEAAIKRIETAIQMLERIRKASIAATYPSDWIIHTSTDSDGAVIRQVGYLQDVGAERAGKPWGIGISAPAIEREDFPDGTYSYHMIAEA